MATVSLSQRIPPIYTVAIAVLAGDAIGSFHLGVALWVAVAIAIASTLAFGARKANLATVLAALAIAAAASAAVRDSIGSTPASSIRRLGEGAEVILEGRMVREAERYQGRLHLFVSVERAARRDHNAAAAAGVVRVTILHPEGESYRIGDRLRVRAELHFPRNFGDPGEFDYESYLAREGIAATAVVTDDTAIEVIARGHLFPWSAIESIRGRIGTVIDSNLDYPEREEMRALVIGDSGGIGRELRDKFALTGMAHLLVISGLHLSLVAAVSFALVRLLLSIAIPVVTIRGWSNKIAAGAAMAAVAGYAAIAGHHLSTMRALVMVLSYAAAVMLDRSREVLASLAMAAIVICLGLAGSTADIGFQLSFASVTAIVLGMRRYEAWWKRNRERVAALSARRQRVARIAAAVGGYVAVSFWALIGTAALTAYHFNQFAIVGIAANAIVVPIMAGGGMIGGLIGSALSFIWPPGGAIVIRIAGYFLTAGTALAGWFAAWPAAWARTFTPSIVEVGLVYSVVLLWLIPRPQAAVS
ncbi:MAG: ComEC/Rec2 family competence protein, partial [Candidatus Binataceae bacterium]